MPNHRRDAQIHFEREERALGAEVKRLRGLLDGLDAWGTAGARARPGIVANLADLEARLSMLRALLRCVEPELTRSTSSGLGALGQGWSARLPS